MTEWARENPWRQGQALSDEAVETLGLINSDALNTTLAVVITHDCDLAAAPDKEPGVEVIVGRFVDEVKGDYSHAKNARSLQVKYRRGELAIPVELTATAKVSIDKRSLATFTPRDDIKLDTHGHAILQAWLAARYRRAAFPDGFEHRLKTAKLHRKIGRAVEPSGQSIVAIFFDVDGGEEIHREGPDDIYELGVYLLYDTTQNEEKAHSDAVKVAEEIEAAFEKEFRTGEGETWKQIKLLYCDVISDQAMTYAQSRLLKQWRLEYLSLGDNPPQPMIEE